MSSPETGMQKAPPSAPPQVGSVAVRNLLKEDAYKKRFEQVLGERAPQFMASITNLAQEPNLANCEPQSIIASAFVAATLDLPIDKNLGVAWLVPYDVNQNINGQWKKRKLAQFQIGYRGFVQLAFRTGLYSGMNAVRVNAEALGRMNPRTGEIETFNSIGEQLIDWEKIDETKEPVGYAFAWELTSGFSKIVYWSKEKVEDHARRYSKAYQYDLKENKQKCPWSTDFDAMAIKTVIKNALSKWGILSVEMQRALKHDQASQITIDTEPIYPDNGENGDKALLEAGTGEKPEVISEDQRQELRALADKHECPDERYAQILGVFGFGLTAHVTTDRFEDVCKAIANWKPAETTGDETPSQDGEALTEQEMRTELGNLFDKVAESHGFSFASGALHAVTNCTKPPKVKAAKLSSAIDAMIEAGGQPVPAKK